MKHTISHNFFKALVISIFFMNIQGCTSVVLAIKSSLLDETAISLKQNNRIFLEYKIKSNLENNYKVDKFVLKVNDSFNNAFDSYSQIKFLNNSNSPKYRIDISIESFSLKKNIDHAFGHDNLLETVKGEISFFLKITDNNGIVLNEKDFNLRNTQSLQNLVNSPESNELTGKLYKESLEDLLNKSIIVIDKYLDGLRLK